MHPQFDLSLNLVTVRSYAVGPRRVEKVLTNLLQDPIAAGPSTTADSRVLTELSSDSGIVVREVVAREVPPCR
jgi:hypothetical protein